MPTSDPVVPAAARSSSDVSDSPVVERPCFDQAWQSFIVWWLTSGGEKRDRNAPRAVFWVEGPSGSGVSTAMRYLAAQLVRGGIEAEVEWESEEGKGDAASAPDLLAVEEPLISGKTTSSWIASLKHRGVAALLTGGSREEREVLERHAEKQLDVTVWTLPPLTGEEAVEMARWWAECGGRQRDATALWQDGLSPAEWLFCLRHGAKLEDLLPKVLCECGTFGLKGFAKSVFLANSLGLSAPVTLLARPQAQDALIRVGKSGLVPLEQSNAGLRILPRWLAAKFANSRSFRKDPQGVQHLSWPLCEVLREWCRAGDTAGATRFIRTLTTHPDFDDLPENDPASVLNRRAVLREVYRLNRKELAGKVPPAALPAWVAVNEAFSGLMLTPDPVLEGMALLEPWKKAAAPQGQEALSPPLLARLGVDLWLAADRRRTPNRRAVQEKVADFLLRGGSHPHTAEAFARILRRSSHAEDLRPAAEGWIRLHPTQPGAVRVLAMLLMHVKNERSFLGWVRRDMVQRQDQPVSSIAGIHAALLLGCPHDPAVREEALRWAAFRRGDAAAGLVWQAALGAEMPPPEVIQGAVVWLRSQPDGSADGPAAKISERLLARFADRPGVPEAAQPWLQRHLDREDAARFLIALARRDEVRSSLGDLAADWVRRHPDHAEAGAVLCRWLPRAVPSVVETAEWWWGHVLPSVSRTLVLASAVRAVHAAPPWLDRALEALPDRHTPCREHLAAAMLHATSASLESIFAALDVLPELYPPAYAFLAGNLGRVLIWHPVQIDAALAEEGDPRRQRELCRVVARALRARPDRETIVFRQLSDAHAALLRESAGSGWPVSSEPQSTTFPTSSKPPRKPGKEGRRISPK